jgi:hypothetical protein
VAWNLEPDAVATRPKRRKREPAEAARKRWFFIARDPLGNIMADGHASGLQDEVGLQQGGAPLQTAP